MEHRCVPLPAADQGRALSTRRSLGAPPKCRRQPSGPSSRWTWHRPGKIRAQVRREYPSVPANTNTFTHSSAPSSQRSPKSICSYRLGPFSNLSVALSWQSTSRHNLAVARSTARRLTRTSHSANSKPSAQRSPERPSPPASTLPDSPQRGSFLLSAKGEFLLAPDTERPYGRSGWLQASVRASEIWPWCSFVAEGWGRRRRLTAPSGP